MAQCTVLLLWSTLVWCRQLLEMYPQLHLHLHLHLHHALMARVLRRECEMIMLSPIMQRNGHLVQRRMLWERQT